ncbi:PGF-pre-PGF domain-containing protein, partial [Candidatus Woesearchaeota archaeon]|nr:PGF-pre-PGF domain-containing protein [Candidatus Woesearchaeota archaeon]
GPIPSVNLTGTVTSGGSPLQNVNVTVRIGSGIFASNYTDSNGDYRIAVENNTAYNVTASLAGYQASTQSVTTNGNTVLDFDLTQTPATGQVHGYVNNFTNISQYLANATVALSQGAFTIATATTDANGYYTMNATSGDYNLTVSKIGFNDGSAAVTITAGSATEQNISLIEQGAVCVQEGPIYSTWGTCSSSQQSRTVTYYNYTGICGNTYVTSETQSCGGGGSSSGGGSSGGSSVSPTINIGLPLPFMTYVTHIYDGLVSGRLYTMNISNPEIAIYELEFTVKDTLVRTITISVGKLLDRPERNLDKDNVYEYDVINHQHISNEEFGSVIARFKVLKSWVEDNDIDVSTISLYRYEDKEWKPLETKKIDQDDEYMYFESNLAGMSEFAIGADRNVYPEEEEEEEPEQLGLSEEEVQELMDACTAEGLKPVPVVGEDGEVLDIECVEYEKEQSALGKAWGVFSDFVGNAWKWLLVAAIVVVVIILLALFGSRIFARKGKEPKPKKEKKKKVALPGITDVNIFTRMWRGVTGKFAAKDEKWFRELDDREFERLVKERRKARLARRKRFLK